jgi:acyl-CoA synthetase (NDP forming)
MSKAFAAVYNFSIDHHNHVKSLKYADINPEIASAILNDAVRKNTGYLTEETAQKVLAAYGLPVLDSYVATDVDQAVELAGKAGFPVVMKVLSDEIVHKYDMGGVVINIKDTNEAEKAYNSIIDNVKKLQPDAKIKGVLIRRMIPEGVEVILGVKRDSSFNTVVMFGLGGIFVEIFKDVSFRVAPIDKKTAESMINEVKSSALLKGARGNAIRDIPAIVDSIQRLSQLAVDHPQIKELDINPMIVLEEGNGCFIADAKIMVTLNKS